VKSAHDAWLKCNKQTVAAATAQLYSIVGQCIFLHYALRRLELYKYQLKLLASTDI